MNDSVNRILAAGAKASAPAAEPFVRGRLYQLRDDNNEHTLRIIVEEDGDVHLAIDSGEAVEFCTRAGGGRHFEVTNAARALAAAVAVALGEDPDHD